MMRWLTAPAVVVLLLSSCSAVTLTYENAHWLLLRQMDRFFDLSWRQTHDAFERLKAVGNAHRRDELPRILEQLALAERIVADGLDRSETDHIQGQGLETYRRAFTVLIPAIVPSLVDLDDEGRDYLTQELSERNLEFRNQYVDLPRTQYLDERGERIIKVVEGWTGPLREEQIKLIDDAQRAIGSNAAAWLAYSIEQQQRTLTLLSGGATPEQVRRRLTEWWVDWAGRTPALEAHTEQWLAGWNALALALDKALDERQRKAVQRRIRTYIKDLEPLIGKVGTTS